MVNKSKMTRDSNELNTELRYKSAPSSTLLFFFFFQTVNVRPPMYGHETEVLREFLFVGFISAHLYEI